MRKFEIFTFVYMILEIIPRFDAVKCYSCSSPQLHLKWPKDEKTNRLLYLPEFPWFANESCETVRDLLPVVDCEGSVCIKAVIKQPPVERSVCETGGAIVRDCWSRVFPNSVKNPRARRDIVRLTEFHESNDTTGIIYTCEGFLCNTSIPKSINSIFLLIGIIFQL